MQARFIRYHARIRRWRGGDISGATAMMMRLVIIIFGSIIRRNRVRIRSSGRDPRYPRIGIGSIHQHPLGVHELTESCELRVVASAVPPRRHDVSFCSL